MKMACIYNNKKNIDNNLYLIDSLKIMMKLIIYT